MQFDDDEQMQDDQIDSDQGTEILHLSDEDEGAQQDMDSLFELLVSFLSFCFIFLWDISIVSLDIADLFLVFISLCLSLTTVS